MKKILCSIILTGLCITLTACSSSSVKSSSSNSESSYYSSSNYEESSYKSNYEESSYHSESSLGYKTTTGAKKTCIACGGTGVIRQYATNDPYDPGYLMECVACHGKGYYYE